MMRLFFNVLTVLLTGIAGPVRGGDASAGAADLHPIAQQAYDLTREHFYLDDIDDASWHAWRDAHLAHLPHDANADAVSAAINAFLAELKTSHTHHYAPTTTKYYELLDLFFQAADNAVDEPERFPHGGTYVGIEIATRVIDDRTIISEVRAGGPGDRAGLRTGDAIIRVDGEPFAEIESFRGTAGRDVVMTIRRERNGPMRDVIVTPHVIRPNDAFERALRDSARLIERNGTQCAYVRVWSYGGQRMQDAVIDVLSSEPLADANGIVLDIRGGWGGASAEYVLPFLRILPRIEMVWPDGRRHRASPRFDKPVAVVIDGGSRSGKELLAYTFKQFDVPLVGERTAGAVVGGRPFLLDDGSMLMIAVVDVVVDGHRLEGVGVVPTVEVPFDVPYAAGADPQLDAALDLLSRD